MQGIGSLYVWNCTAALKGIGTLSVGGMPRYGSATLTGEGFCYALGSYNYATSQVLPALSAIGADHEFAQAPNQELPSLYATGSGGGYVPPPIVFGYGNLPRVLSSGHMITEMIMAGSGSLGALLSKGGDYAYGVSSQNLPALTTHGRYGEHGYVSFVSTLIAFDGISVVADIPAPMDCVGNVNAPAPVINASFGIYGALEIPVPVINGVISTVTYTSGNLDVPLPVVSGTFNATSLFVGDLDMPIPVISGTLIIGNTLAGNLNIPVPRISGTITQLDEWAGDIQVPVPKIKGVILSSTDDSAWAYSGDTVCQP